MDRGLSKRSFCNDLDRKLNDEIHRYTRVAVAPKVHFQVALKKCTFGATATRNPRAFLGRLRFRESSPINQPDYPTHRANGACVRDACLRRCLTPKPVIDSTPASEFLPARNRLGEPVMSRVAIALALLVFVS